MLRARIRFTGGLFLSGRFADSFNIADNGIAINIAINNGSLGRSESAHVVS